MKVLLLVAAALVGLANGFGAPAGGATTGGSTMDTSPPSSSPAASSPAPASLPTAVVLSGGPQCLAPLTYDKFNDEKNYDADCIFPFKYYGYTFHACTSADYPAGASCYDSVGGSVASTGCELSDFNTFQTCWCPTALDNDGNYVDVEANGYTTAQWKSCDVSSA